MHDFGRRERGDLCFTRKAFARLFECREQDVVQVMQQRFDKGYKREIEVSFPGL